MNRGGKVSALPPLPFLCEVMRMKFNVSGFDSLSVGSVDLEVVDGVIDVPQEVADNPEFSRLVSEIRASGCVFSAIADAPKADEPVNDDPPASPDAAPVADAPKAGKRR